MRPSNIRCQQSEQGVELAILGEITSYTAEQIIAAVNFFRDQPITITVMSGGGDAFASLGLYDFLKGKDVTVRIYGIAASGAAIISAAARTTEMAAGAFMMIHNAYSITDGQAQDVLNAMNDRQVEVFAAKSGQRKDKIKKMLEAETFLSADEAYDMGFVDKVFDPLKIAASLNTMKTMEQVMNTTTTDQVVSTTTADQVVSTTAADLSNEQAEAEATEEVEVEVPVSAVEAMQAAVRGHLKAKVNVSAKYGAIVAQLTDELKTLKAQLDEANAAVEVAEATAAVDAAQADAAKAAAEAAQAAAAQAQAEVEALKATPLETPVVSDAQPTAVVPAAPAAPAPNKATAHAERMARTLDKLDRKFGLKPNN